MMKKHIIILKIILILTFLTCCLTGCDEQSGQTTAVGDSNESAAESETNSTAETSPETEAPETTNTVAPFPRVQFAESGTLPVTHLPGFGTDDLLDADEEYLYFRNVSPVPDSDSDVDTIKVYRTSRENPDKQELIAHYKRDTYEFQSWIYNGDYYVIRKLGDARSLFRYSPAHPDEPHSLFTTPSDWENPAIKPHGRYLAVTYQLPSADETAYGWQAHTTLLTSYDLESGEWSEISRFDYAFQMRDKVEFYLGDYLRYVNISDDYIVWSKLMPNNEALNSDSITYHYFRYSLADKTTEKMIQNPDHMLNIWGGENIFICSKGASAKLYFYQENQWYEHKVPSDSSTSPVEKAYQPGEDLYAFHTRNQLYLYDLSTLTCWQVDLAEATDAQESVVSPKYNIYYCEDTAFCQVNIRNVQGEVLERRLYQIDLGVK